MKALTLTQPWASLVAVCEKQLETRSWSTRYRGPLLIHAAAGFAGAGGKRAAENLTHLEPFRSALMAAGQQAGEARIFSFGMLPLGAIVAKCDLLDVIETAEEVDALREGVDVGDLDGVRIERELAFGNFTPGRFAWVLAHVERLAEPIPCTGALGLWTPPAHVIEALS